MAESTPSSDLARTVLAVLFLSALLVTSIWILLPFLPALTWAVLLVVATWPVLMRAQTWCGGRRWLAVTSMLVVLLLTFMLPLGLAVSVLVDRAPAIAAWIKELPEKTLPMPPAWVHDLPLVGQRLADSWRELASQGPEGLQARIAPHADELAAWFATKVGGAGILFVHFVLTLLLAGLLYARGEGFADEVRRFARRLAGDNGDRAAMLAARATRAVALGVVVTALVQAVIGGIGLVVAGIPVPGLLTATMFVLSVAQIGAAPVLAVASIWLFANDHTGWGIAMVVWTVVVGSLDNVIRPLLIKKGVELPLVLVFFGVVGGLIAFGVQGLFIGPVVLAVLHALLASWLHDPEPAAAGGSAAA